MRLIHLMEGGHKSLLRAGRKFPQFEFMNKIPQIILICIGLLVVGGLRMEAADKPWSGEYKGEDLPLQSFPPWREDVHSGTAQIEIVKTDKGKALRVVIGDTNRVGWRISSDPVFFPDEASRVTLEMRARIVSGDDFVIGLELRKGAIGMVSMRVNQFSIELQGAQRAQIPYSVGSGFHLYQLILCGGKAELFIDEEKKPLASIPVRPAVGMGNGWAHWIEFGDFGSVSGQGVVEYDFVRWRCEGS